MDFKNSKKNYEQLPIPDGFEDNVKKAIEYGLNRTSANTTGSTHHTRIYRHLTYVSAGICAAMLALVIGVHTSPVFAQTLSEVPVIGSMVRVFAAKSYHEAKDNVSIDVTVPAISVEMSSDSGTTPAITEAMLNAKIQSVIDDYIIQAEQLIEEYKAAFIATGGSEEEWNSRSINIASDYTINYQQGSRLSLTLVLYNANGVSYLQQTHYYNYDFATGKELTLADILGADYINIANSSIIAQIEEQIKSDDNKAYFGYNTSSYMDTLKFTSISSETDFYINADGLPVVCFPKYSIAPGYMGICEFVIK